MEVIFCAYYINDRGGSVIRAADRMHEPPLHATPYNVLKLAGVGVMWRSCALDMECVYLYSSVKHFAKKQSCFVVLHVNPLLSYVTEFHTKITLIVLPNFINY